MAGQARYFWVRPGSFGQAAEARFGVTTRGVAGEAQQGVVRLGRQVELGPGMAWPGAAGEFWIGASGYPLARQAC